MPEPNAYEDDRLTAEEKNAIELAGLLWKHKPNETSKLLKEIDKDIPIPTYEAEQRMESRFEKLEENINKTLGQLDTDKKIEYIGHVKKALMEKENFTEEEVDDMLKKMVEDKVSNVEYATENYKNKHRKIAEPTPTSMANPKYYKPDWDDKEIQKIANDEDYVLEQAYKDLAAIRSGRI